MAEEYPKKENSSAGVQHHELLSVSRRSSLKLQVNPNAQPYEEMLENFKKIPGHRTPARSTPRPVIQPAELHLDELRLTDSEPPASPIINTQQWSKIGILNEHAMIFYKMKRYEEAMTVYSNVIMENPIHPVVYKNRAMVLEALGQYKQASLDYKKAIQITRKEAIFPQTPRKSVYKFRTLKEELEEVQKQIKTALLEEDIEDLKTQEATLETLLILKVDVEIAQKAFKKHANLETFFWHFIAKLEEVLIGYKIISREFEIHNGKGMTKEIELLGRMIPLLPPDASESANILKNAANLGPLVAVLKHIEITARKLIEAYRDQLPKLRTAEEENMQDEKYRNTPPSSQSQEELAKKDFSVTRDIAEYGVLKILEAFQEGQIDFDQIVLSIDEQFIHAVMEPFSSEINEKLSQQLGLYTFTNRFGRKWNFHDFYGKPVVKTPEGFCYGGGQLDVDTYGYRYASILEAQRWRLTKFVPDDKDRPARRSLSLPIGTGSPHLSLSEANLLQAKVEGLTLSRTLTDMQEQFAQLEKKVSGLQEKKPVGGNCFCS